MKSGTALLMVCWRNDVETNLVNTDTLMAFATRAAPVTNAPVCECQSFEIIVTNHST
jgi:hypothetical protein